MPGMYEGEDYDLAGFCVGVVEKSEIIDGSKVAAGDALLALPSSGPHPTAARRSRKIRSEVGSPGADIGNIQLDGKPLTDPVDGPDPTTYAAAAQAGSRTPSSPPCPKITCGVRWKYLPRAAALRSSAG